MVIEYVKKNITDELNYHITVFVDYMVFHLCCALFLQFLGKTFLRPGQMNINVATWGRLMKRALPSLPPNCGEGGVYSPPTAKPGKSSCNLRKF